MELQAYIQPLLRWWWLMVISTVIATISSFFYLQETPATFQASTTLMVGNAIESLNPNSNEMALTQQLAGTYANIAKRKLVQDKTKEALGMEWLPEYDARVVWNTQLVEIIVLDTSPERAQAVANELAHQLILQSPTSSENQDSQQFIQEQLNWLQARIYETQQEIDTARVELAESFSASRIAERQAYITSLEVKLSSLQANYVAYQANTQQGAINTIRVIEQAELPTQPADPNKAIKIMLLAAIVGVALAAGAAYILDYLDNSLRSRREIETALRLPVLGTVPKSPTEPAPGRLTAVLEDHPAVIEAYRELRTNLQFLSMERPLRSLLITSPAPTEGKSRVASNLAAALAYAGYRVILLDIDLLRPKQHEQFDLPNEVGIINALKLADPNLDDFLYTTQIPQLYVMPAGHSELHDGELLNSARMARLLHALEDRADFVILDSPPVNAATDAVILSTLVTGALLVVDFSRTDRSSAQRAVKRLQQVRANVLGTVINRMPIKDIDYFLYDYHRPGRNGAPDRRSGIDRRSGGDRRGVGADRRSQGNKEPEKVLNQ